MVTAILRLAAVLLAMVPLAASARLFVVASPTHEQTFAYGSERHQQWMTRGPDRHLALSAEFTNDPYVDKVNPRQYDDFIFDFPDIRLSRDGRTFYYHPAHGNPVSVAERHAGLFGLESIHLLDHADLVIRKPHGLLSLVLIVHDRPPTATASL